MESVGAEGIHELVGVFRPVEQRSRRLEVRESEPGAVRRDDAYPVLVGCGLDPRRLDPATGETVAVEDGDSVLRTHERNSDRTPVRQAEDSILHGRILKGAAGPCLVRPLQTFGL